MVTVSVEMGSEQTAREQTANKKLSGLTPINPVEGGRDASIIIPKHHSMHTLV